MKRFCLILKGRAITLLAMRSAILLRRIQVWATLGLMLMGSGLWAQQQPLAGPTPAPASTNQVPEALAKKLAEVQALQADQKVVDALLMLEELERDYPNAADLCNVRGSILLTPSMRDFAGAEAAFTRAAALQVGALAPLFNLAEVQFVKHEWQEALKRLDEILRDFEKLPTPVRHLILFKKTICQVKTNQIEAAEKLIKDHFTFMDDTPAYYFSKAAVAFQQEKKAEAEEWVSKGVSIFGDKNCMAYLDCLMEARWVPNTALPPVPGK